MNDTYQSDIVPIITYHNNDTGLAVTIHNLQSQLICPKLIIVVDTSPDRRGLAIADRYNTERTKIVVIHKANLPIYSAWNMGIEVATKALPDCHVLILNDDVLLPMNAIDLFDQATKYLNALCFVPITPPATHYSRTVDLPFDHYAQVPVDVKQYSEFSWMPGFCFLLTREAINTVGLFDEQFTVWYGDDDYQRRLKEAEQPDYASIVRIDTLFVFHYGGSTFDYEKDPKTQAAIMEDKEKFVTKYPQK